MNILKKIIATIIMLTLCGQMTIWTFAADYTQWELDYTKNSIMSEIDWWDAMITKIDALIANMTDEQTKTLETKLAAIKEKMTSVETSYSYELSKEEKILLILDYIQLKIELNKNLAKKEEVLWEFSQTLTDTENQKVNEELVKIQKNILTHWTVYLENILLGSLKNTLITKKKVTSKQVSILTMKWFEKLKQN